MKDEKIIQAIAAIIGKNTLGLSAQHNRYSQEVAAEIFAAISPHIKSQADWTDAPPWAKYRTVDLHGAVTYWEEKPYPDTEFGIWVLPERFWDSKWEYAEEREDWKDTLEERPG